MLLSEQRPEIRDYQVVNSTPKSFRSSIAKRCAPFSTVSTVCAAVAAITLVTLSFPSPHAMAKPVKNSDLMKGDFSEILSSLRGGTAEPTTSNAQLQLKQFSVKSNGVDRFYYVHVPPDYNGKTATPLVLAFHGAGGHARAMPQLTGLNKCSDKHSFIVVYPDGLNSHWNDGYGGKTRAELEDVDFVKLMLSQIITQYKIDKTRVYAAGMSNGGFFSQYLSINMPNTFAALASISASLEEPTYKKLKPEQPISILFVHGDDDDVVPFNGGSIGVSGALEEKTIRKATSAAQAVGYWVKANQCSDKPVITNIPDAKPSDGTHAVRKVYSGGKNGTEVILIAIQNGGHTWPSGWQYLPESIVGKTSRVVNASEEIWNLFQRHHL